MTATLCSGKSALRKPNGSDLPATGARYHSTTSAEIFQFRRNSSEAADESQLSDDRELALMNLMKAGDFDARQQMVTRNLRVVLNSTRRYANKGIRIFGLLKAGNQGLEHALENFGQEGGRYFSTYAAWCIRRNIEHVLLNPEGSSPAVAGKSNHAQYRIIPSGDADPSSLCLVPDSRLHTHGKID